MDALNLFRRSLPVATLQIIPLVVLFHSVVATTPKVRTRAHDVAAASALQSPVWL